LVTLDFAPIEIIASPIPPSGRNLSKRCYNNFGGWGPAFFANQDCVNSKCFHENNFYHNETDANNFNASIFNALLI
jgi:hypothetical protein